jgi:hypothetical protein
MKMTSKNLIGSSWLILFILVCMLITPQISAWNTGLNESLFNYYSFNQNTGTNAIDLYAKNNLTLRASTIWGTGILGSGVDVAGNSFLNTTFPIQITGNSNRSMNIWINLRNLPFASGTIFQIGAESANNMYRFNILDTGQMNLQQNTHDHSFVGFKAPLNEWDMYTITFNGTTHAVYFNGILNDTWATTASATSAVALFLNTIGSAVTTNHLNTSYDEFGIWNRTLNSSDISQLYNGGVGLSPDIPFPIVNLITPADNYNVVAKTINFNITTSGTSLINITLFLDGITNETQFISGNTNASLFTKTFSGTGNHTWYGYVCDSIGCTTSSTRSFNISSLIINSQTYNPSTTSGNLENFTLNFTIASGETLNSVYFMYNNTQYSPSITNNVNDYLSSYSLNVPSVSSAKNKTFWWTINLASGQTNTTKTNQTINTFNIDDCSVFTTKLLNLTLYDELTQVMIPSGSAGNGTIEVTVNIYPLNQYPNPAYLVGSVSRNFNNTNTGTICVSSALGNSSYYMDSQIRYSALGYVTKFYNIQKYLLTNATTFQNISLYNLPSTSSQNFQITLKDSDFLPLANTLIMIQRKYVGDGVFKTVEIPLSDYSGTATGHFDLSGVDYTISLVQNGITLATFNNIAVVCTNPNIEVCQLNLNVPSATSGYTDFSTINNLAYIMNFNPSTRTINLQFNTLDGTPTTMNMTAVSYNDNSIGLCSTTLTSSAGNFNCVIPGSFGNGTILVTLYQNGNYTTQNIYSITQNPTSIYGNDAMIYVVILLSTIVLMFITSTTGMLVGLVIGLITVAVLNLFIVKSWTGTISSIVWVIIAIAIVGYKLSQRARENG